MEVKLKKMNHTQRDVFMLLPLGMNRLISTQDIENILGLDKRHVMMIIEELIIEYGIPIGSMRDKNKYGYFIATDNEEKIRGTFSLENQAAAMDKRVKKVKAADVEIAYQYKELYANAKTKEKQKIEGIV